MSESDIVKRLEQGMKAASFNDWDFERTEADMQEGADTITALRAKVEKLEGALAQLARYNADEDAMDWADTVLEMNAIACAALEEKP